MDATPIVRPGREADLPALLRLYNHWVDVSHATFDTEPIPLEVRRRKWFATFAETGPHRLLVAEADGEPGVHRALGGIAEPNPASIALHEALGFRHLGTFTEVGFKYGRYWDVAWYERDCAAAP